ncbi:Trm112 family protein [Nitrospira sp. NS4]|uniref:Trm112 family protein n=1 Tax=Nitrospira sp. NS4 TaxID=3414498 RepID=UPI003C2AB4B2
MSVDKDLLAILCCPETKQPVSLAGTDLLTKLNDAVRKGNLRNTGKQPVTDELDGGLVRSDLKIVYPIRENIPVMLIEEGIPLEQLT